MVSNHQTEGIHKGGDLLFSLRDYAHPKFEQPCQGVRSSGMKYFLFNIMLLEWTWIFQLWYHFVILKISAKCGEPLVLSWKFPQVYLDYLQVCGRYKATERWKATAAMTVLLWFETSLCNLDSTKWQTTKDEDLKLQQLFRAILPLDQGSF